MRISLFEKMKSQKLNFADEANKIINIIDNDIYLRENVNNEFQLSSFNVYAHNYDEFTNLIFNENKLNRELYLQPLKFNDFILTLDDFLDILEFYKTLTLNKTKVLNKSLGFYQLNKVLDYCVEKLGYGFRLDESIQCYKVYLKNEIAEAVALNVKSSTKDYIYRYLMTRSGDIESKRNIIKSLADDVELICKKHSEYNKLKEFIQCVRHTKEKPISTFPFYYEDEEKWLDKIFEMVIGALSFVNSKNIMNEIKTLQGNI